MFSVRTGTFFEESRLPMRVWVLAFWRAAVSKKGCSALELAREMEITHKSALLVLRRIGHGLGTSENAPKRTGTVEADETYVGGRPRRFGVEILACRRFIRSRCQRRTVSGRTSNWSRRNT